MADKCNLTRAKSQNRKPILIYALPAVLKRIHEEADKLENE
jgi:hypothetical protein